MSLELTKVSFYEKVLIHRPPWRKLLEVKVITELSHLQIWTNYDLADETEREKKFDINLAILTSKTLWDVECESQITKDIACILITSYITSDKVSRAKTQ